MKTLVISDYDGLVVEVKVDAKSQEGPLTVMKTTVKNPESVNLKTLLTVLPEGKVTTVVALKAEILNLGVTGAEVNLVDNATGESFTTTTTTVAPTTTTTTAEETTTTTTEEPTTTTTTEEPTTTTTTEV